MKIIISGASGDLGRKITAIVLEKIPATDLILLTRNPASLTTAAVQGAQVRHADFGMPDLLPAAMAGGDILLLISTLSIGKRVQQHTNAIHAAKAAGVSQVVYTSSCGIQPQTPSISGREHYATEQVLQNCGLAFTILRNSWYADVIPQFLLPAAIASGSLISSCGSGLVAPVAKSDCARVASAVLEDPQRHKGAIYEITGPALLTFADIARLCSKASGKPVACVEVSHDEKLAMFDAMGVKRDYEEGMMNENTNAWASNEMITYEMAIRQQYFSICSNHVELVTGVPAESLDHVLSKHATG